MERTLDFEQLLFLYKTEGKDFSLNSFVSTMALTIEPLTDGTAITMKVSSRHKFLVHLKMRIRAHH
jgi:hypothetical protein